MKDLFTGSLGHLDNHGGSPMFTTPNTIYVPPEYEVETDVPSVAEFVTCSLDGRLWVWKRSRRYYVSAFRWNEETERLEFVSTTILNGETVQKRGVDWILTDKSFLRSQAEAPYISRTEYDSDDTTYSDAIEKCYSFWPELETWQEIRTTYNLTVEGSPSDKWETIPLRKNTVDTFELYYDGEDIKVITDFPPRLIYFNGQLYGRGKANIGRVYLLPKTIDSDGVPTNFYLFTCPDYIRQYDTEISDFSNEDGWNNLLLAQLNKDSVCIFTPETEDFGVCKKAKNGQVLSLLQNEQVDFNEDNGAIFFDGLTRSDILLNNKGASLFCDELLYKCKGFNQWLAPTGNIEYISPQIVVSSYREISFVCFLEQKFYRVFYQGKNLIFLIDPKNRKIHMC